MQGSRSELPAVLVTGASTGIGAACVEELVRRGVRVFAGVRQEAHARALYGRTPAVVPLMLDVSDAAQIAAAAQTVKEAVGAEGLAGLVNNAGIVVAGPLEILPVEEVRRQFEVNVVGLVAVTQAMLPLLRAARGRIVNIGSFNGRVASPYLAPYSASKHALAAISDALRVELRTWGIRVALVEPGATETPIWEKAVAAAEWLAENAARDGVRLYQPDLDAMRGATQRLARSALPVATVVRCVLHALTARRPRSRYPVGWHVDLLFRAHKWVPNPIWDWLVRRSLGLPK